MWLSRGLSIVQDAVDISDVFNKARLDMITAPKADESQSCEAFRLQFMLGRPVPRHWSMLCCVLSFRDIETFRFQGFFFSFHFIGDHIFSHHLDPRAGNVPETMRFRPAAWWWTPKAPDRTLLPPPKAGHWSHAPATYRSSDREGFHPLWSRAWGSEHHVLKP